MRASTILATTIALLCASGAAHAVHLSQNGTGQVLIFPYYTVNGGNQSLLSIVNTRDEVKALKVRFREARNGREVLDFNLYLAPFDVWTGAIFSTSISAPAGLTTTDNSCTVPALKNDPALPLIGTQRYAPFRNFNYTLDRNDGGGSEFERSREGMLEVIEMGVLRSGMEAAALAEEATHTSAGIPKNCPALFNAWVPNGAWSNGGAAGFTDAPSGGVMGALAVVDVAEGTMLSYRAAALDGFFATGTLTDDLHSEPGTSTPDLSSATPPVSQSWSKGDGHSKLVTSTWSRGIDAVSAVLMSPLVSNEYTTDERLGSTTEWVVSFPTKQFYVDDQKFGGPAGTLTSANSGLIRSRRPFSGFGFTRTTPAGLSPNFACEYVDLKPFDRESGTVIDGGVSFPEPPPGDMAPRFCEQVSVVAMSQDGAASALLGSARYSSVDMPFIDGWLRTSFGEHEQTGEIASMTSIEGHQYFGLPVLGFAAVRIVNARLAPGVLANYAGLIPHITESRVEQ